MKTHIIFALTIAIANNIFAEQVLHRSGTVRYPDGEPAADVQIIFYPGNYYSDDDYNYHEAISDKNGHYEIVPPKKVSDIAWGPIILTNCIMAHDVEKNFAAVQAFAVTTTNVDLTLQPAITLSGSVKNTEGAPVNGAEIGLGFVSAPYGYYMRPPFKANEQGQFSIPALPQGFEYWISGITAKGYGSSTATVKAKDTQTNHYEFPTFVLKHADCILAGQVLDMDGKPVAGADVDFRGDGQPQNSKTKTDGEGKFFTDTVCEGVVRVSAVLFGPPFMSDGGGAGAPVQAGDTNVIIRIRDPNVMAGAGPEFTAAGTVFDPSGKPLPIVFLAVWRSANPFLNFYSDINGKYKVNWKRAPAAPISRTGRTPPNFKAVLVGRDAVDNLAATLDLDETTTNLDLHLEAGLTLSGSVQDSDGMPLTNAKVSLEMTVNRAGAELANTVSDTNGSFFFSALPQNGEYDLNVSANGYGSARNVKEQFDVTQSKSFELPPIQLKLANLQLAGTVVDPEGKPVSGATVSAYGEGQPNDNVQSDADGHFVFKQVAEGAIRVAASKHDSNGGSPMSIFMSSQGGEMNVLLKLAVQTNNVARLARPPQNRSP